MVPVFPYHIRRSDTGDCGELLLSLQDRKSAMVLKLSLEQARMLAVEMRGLATDRCTLHHLALAVTRALGADVIGVIISGVDLGRVTGALRLETGDRMYDVNVDVTAALAMAFHLGLPIFMESNYLDGEDWPQAEPSSGDSWVGPQIPQAFREVIEAISPEAIEPPPADAGTTEGGASDDQ